MRCPFMIKNADVLRAMTVQATPKQRAAVREFAKQFAASGMSINSSSDRAYFVVRWLRLLGEDTAAWVTTRRDALVRAKRATLLDQTTSNKL